MVKQKIFLMSIALLFIHSSTILSPVLTVASETTATITLSLLRNSNYFQYFFEEDYKLDLNALLVKTKYTFYSLFVAAVLKVYRGNVLHSAITVYICCVTGNCKATDAQNVCVHRSEVSNSFKTCT